MNLELSKEIEFLFKTNNWDWNKENTQNVWKEKFQTVIRFFPSDFFFLTFSKFLSNKSDLNIEGIINHFIKEVVISLRELKHPDCVKLSGNLLEVQKKLLAQKRPIHKHWNSVLHMGIRLDRRLFFNQLIQCFLEQASSDLTYNIWVNRFHLIFNPPFEYKRNTPGNDFEFLPKIFHFNKISKDLRRNILYVKYEPNHQEILIFIIRQKINLIDFSKSWFEDIFSLIKDIKNDHEALSLITEHVDIVASELKNIIRVENLNEKEVSSLSHYFTYLQKNIDEYDFFINKFNNQIGDERTLFRLWTLFRYFSPSVDLLERYFEKMNLADYLQSSKEFHIHLFKVQIIEYNKYKQSDHTFFGLLVMSLIESPSNILHLVPFNSILNKVAVFYSFNSSFSWYGKPFELTYEYENYEFKSDEILSLESIEIDCLDFIKRRNFIKLLQNEYAHRTKRFEIDRKEIGFFKMDVEDRVGIINSCWNKTASLPDGLNEHLSTIISSINSMSTLLLGEIMIKSIIKGQYIITQKILQNIERNAKDEYRDRLLQFVKFYFE